MGTLFAKSPVSNEMKKVNPFMTAKKGFKEGTYYKISRVNANSGITFKVKSQQHITLNCVFYEICYLNDDYFVCLEEPIRYISGSVRIGVLYNHANFHEIGKNVSLNTSGTLNFDLKASSLKRDIKEGSVLIIQGDQNKYYLVCWNLTSQSNFEQPINTSTTGIGNVSGLVYTTLLNLDTDFLPVGNKTFLTLSYPVFAIDRDKIFAFQQMVGLNIK